MNPFDIIITNPIARIIETTNNIVQNYVISIFIFALLIKILLFPFSLWAQYQSVKLAKIKPKVDDIKAYSGDDWRGLRKELKALYKKEKYSGFAAMLPLLLQLPVIIGVIRAFDTAGIMSAPPESLLIPLLSGVSAFVLCYVQNKCNVLAKQMGFLAKWGFAIFLTAFSLYFAAVSGEGFGIYWTAGNLFAVAVQLLCNLIYNPKKYISYEILPPEKADRAEKRLARQKQRQDMAAFSKADKELVFYSEKSGFYKYFKGLIEHILKNSNIHVHYLTSDAHDKVFDITHPKFHAYYCGYHKLITVFMKLDCKVCVTTLADLHKYQYKRSIVNKNIEYIYLDHGFGSVSISLKKNALDYYDTVFCYGENYRKEIIAMEKYYGSKEKNLVNAGYTLFDELEKNYVPPQNERKTIIIAPSWQKDNIFDFCLDGLMSALNGSGYKVILRPHPEYIKRFPLKIKSISQRYGNELQLDFSSSILSADIVITDWSSVGVEFAYASNKPAMFINTPIKVMNPDYDKYGIVPLEISLRDKIGVAVDTENIADIKQYIEKLTDIKNPREIIKSIMYDNATANETGGQYIIRAVRRK